MRIEKFIDFVKRINEDLGIDFCNQFQYKRKELAGLSRAATRNQLFGNIKDTWAINEGGGIEVQYHIGLDEDDLLLVYGIGFNTQYVPFANEMSMVKYVRPYMKAFLALESEIREILPEYKFVYGDINELRNPEENKYYLFGKSIQIQESQNGYLIEDDEYNSMISDLKSQYPAYVQIFEKRNQNLNTSDSMESIKKVLQEKFQIILQGPPGTGKTYFAKELAYYLITGTILSKDKEERERQEKNLSESEQYRIVQFHPSYSYEDFVRGIVVKTKDSVVEYKTINKSFAAFADIANENYQNSLKNPEEYSIDTWIDSQLDIFREWIEDELASKGLIQITEKVYIFQVDEDCYRYKGDSWQYEGRANFADLNNIIRTNIGKHEKDFYIDPALSIHAKYRKPYYLSILKLFFNRAKPYNLTVVESEKLKNFIFIIDEINRANLPSVLGELIYALEYRNENVDSMYTLEDGTRKICIPPNLYIIGTMNTADRSIGHIDYAIRRRFAFVEMLPTSEPLNDFAKPLFAEVSSLFIKNFDSITDWQNPIIERSPHLASDIQPQHVWIGHSYFITDDQEKLKLRLKYEIIPILKEYLNDGVLLETGRPIIDELSKNC